MIFANAKIGLGKLLFTFYSFLRFNRSIHLLGPKLTVSYRSLRRRVEQFARTLNGPVITPFGPVEIDEVYVTTGLKGSATGSRTRVASRNAVVEFMPRTSHRCSHSLIAVAVSDMLSRRNLLTNQPCDPSSATARRSR